MFMYYGENKANLYVMDPNGNLQENLLWSFIAFNLKSCIELDNISHATFKSFIFKKKKQLRFLRKCFHQNFIRVMGKCHNTL